MSVTEVGCMGVKPGLDIMDETTPEGQILLKAWKPIPDLPGGPHRAYWGLEIENPLKVWAFFDWDSIEHHEKFAKSFGGEAVKDLPLILTHGEFTKHITFTPSPPLVLLSPVTDAMLAYFPSDISPAEKDKAAAQFQQYVEKSFDKSPDVKSVSYGWGVENDFPVNGVGEGQKGSLLTAFIGWPSIEAHIKFQETNAFNENMDLIRAMERIVKLVVFHMSCRSQGKKTE